MPDRPLNDPLADSLAGLMEDQRAEAMRRVARALDLDHLTKLRTTRVVLAAAHLDHNPQNNRLRNLKALCPRCHMTHDRPHHLGQRRIT